MAPNTQVVAHYGTMWARNTDNIGRVPLSKEPGGKGIYILFDGSMPLYVGKGNISARLKSARRSKRRGQLWDSFNWYGLADPKMMHDSEVLTLRMFPRCLRSLTQQDGHFVEAEKATQGNRTADLVTRKPRTRKRKRT